MGFYCETKVMKNGQRLQRIQREKGGLGQAYILFRAEDAVVEKSYRGFKTTVRNAIANAEEVLAIYEATGDIGKLDKWAQNAYMNERGATEDFLMALRRYPDAEVWGDESEAGEHVSLDSLKGEPLRQIEAIQRLCDGLLSNRHLYGRNLDLAQSVKKDIATLLEPAKSMFVHEVYDFGTSYEPEPLMIGDELFVTLKKTITFKPDAFENIGDSSNLAEEALERITAMFRPAAVGVRRLWDESGDPNAVMFWFVSRIDNPKLKRLADSIRN